MEDRVTKCEKCKEQFLDALDIMGELYIAGKTGAKIRETMQELSVMK